MTSRPNNTESPHTSTEDTLKAVEVEKHFTMPMEVFRELYKTEIHVLWQEVEHFRELCRRQMAKQRALLKEHRLQCEEALGESLHQYSAPDLPSDFSRQLRKLEENMTFLEDDETYRESCRNVVANGRVPSLEPILRVDTKPMRDGNSLRSVEGSDEIQHKSSLLDTGQADVNQVEEHASQLSKEAALNLELQKSLKRLESLDSEAQSYHSLSDTATNSSETSSKARKHWMTARKHLIDKMTLLEATVKRYRAELAAATMKITAKEMEMAQLNKQMCELRGDLKKKDRKIEELEDRLTNTLEDKSRSERNLELFMEELQNIDLQSTISPIDKQEHSHPPPKQQPSLKQKLLRRQHSSMSFFGPSKDKSSKSSVGGAPQGSGESTPDNDSPQLCRRFSHPPVLEDVNTYEDSNENARQILNEILSKGGPTNKEEQTILKKCYGVENSSRACAVM